VPNHKLCFFLNHKGAIPICVEDRLARGLHISLIMNSETLSSTHKFGLRYFSDDLHYRVEDLRIWLPQWKTLNCQWLVLYSTPWRAIPEAFLAPIIENGIIPVIQIHQSPIVALPTRAFDSILGAYARWGVRHVVFFDRPNQRQQWSQSQYIAHELPQRFWNIWLPLAEHARDFGFAPILPALEQGGSYWDTSFLTALLSLVRQTSPHLLNELQLGIYAYSNHANVDWGAGGEARWQATRPYFTPADSQDQLGFRSFEWYDPICQRVLGRSLPQIMLGGGYLPVTDSKQSGNLLSHNLHIAKQAQNPQALPDYLLNVALPSMDGDNLPVLFNQHAHPTSHAKQLREWLVGKATHRQPKDAMSHTAHGSSKRMSHYVLLQPAALGGASWQMEAAQTFAQHFQAVLGFSATEAQNAQQVSLFAEDSEQIREVSAKLQKSGCKTEQIVASSARKLQSIVGNRVQKNQAFLG